MKIRQGGDNMPTEDKIFTVFVVLWLFLMNHLINGSLR